MFIANSRGEKLACGIDYYLFPFGYRYVSRGSRYGRWCVWLSIDNDDPWTSGSATVRDPEKRSWGWFLLGKEVGTEVGTDNSISDAYICNDVTWPRELAVRSILAQWSTTSFLYLDKVRTIKSCIKYHQVSEMRDSFRQSSSRKMVYDDGTQGQGEDCKRCNPARTRTSNTHVQFFRIQRSSYILYTGLE